MDVQLLALSDFRGQLDTFSSALLDGGTGMVAGASVLAAWFARERAVNPNTIVVASGDSFGASPTLSSLLADVPTVAALGQLGVRVDALGERNFQRGLVPLAARVGQASYAHVASNLNNLLGALPSAQSPFTVVDVGGVRVGFVGLTNPDAPAMLFPGRMGPLTITEPITAATSAAAAARSAGAHVVVALADLGVTIFSTAGAPLGPLVDFADGVTGFLAIFGGHSNVHYLGARGGQVIAQNKMGGATYTRLSFTVHTGTGAVSNVQAASVVALRDGFFPDGGPAADPAMEALLSPYRAQLTAELDRPIGKTTGIFVRDQSQERRQEMPIGDLVADALRATYQTDLALVNGGILRAPLPSSYVVVDAGVPVRRTGCAPVTPCDLVQGDVAALLPFGNLVVTRNITGSQLWSALENGVQFAPTANGRFPQISGFGFVYDPALPPGSRVVSVTTSAGVPIADNAGVVYSLATLDFLNSGGDGYGVLNDGAGHPRETAMDVVTDFIRDAGVLSPLPDAGRITTL